MRWRSMNMNTEDGEYNDRMSNLYVMLHAANACFASLSLQVYHKEKVLVRRQR